MQDWIVLKSSIIICGVGSQSNHFFEVIGKKKLKIPPLHFNGKNRNPVYYPRPILLKTQQNELFYIKDKTCKILKNNSWILHSKTNFDKEDSVILSMLDGLYAFGGSTHQSKYKIEFLKYGSNVWQSLETSIPDSSQAMFKFGVAISATEMLLMGGLESNTGKAGSTIMKFNIETKEWCTGTFFFKIQSHFCDFNHILIFPPKRRH